MGKVCEAVQSSRDKGGVFFKGTAGEGGQHVLGKGGVAAETTR